MLELRGITKAYVTASLTQVALNDINLAFRDNEFVAILGQSGSGKTTMLNVVGGLDQFDSGDLLIDGISTKNYRARDWDTYRNNRIGFVFQAYNLIPHQSVLANVELALTLSGVGRAERKRRAIQALTEVGLADHIHKKPNQLSGGQMQRVALARALVNDPEILLADEPTGALDSQTSLQVMDLLKAVARDRLVIMVTHNPELAHTYATRIVELADGQVIADTDPYIPGVEDLRQAKVTRKTSMSFLTAMSLSFNNLLTKKGRTIMTSTAGSIGIIGIAAILALANGVNEYIAQTEEEMLSAYPLTINRAGTDMAAAFSAFSAGPAESSSDTGNEAQESETTNITTVASAARLEETLDNVSVNDLKSLRTFFKTDGSRIDSHVDAIEYSYDVTPQLYLPDTTTIRQVNPSTLGEGIDLTNILGPVVNSSISAPTFHQLPETKALYENEYDVLKGHWPTSANEVVLVLSADGTIEENVECNMGIRDCSELKKLIDERTGKNGSTSTTASTDAATPSASRQYSLDEMLNVTFRLVHASDLYVHDAERAIWVDRSDDNTRMKTLIDNGETISVVGVVKAKPESKEATLSSGLYYTADLTTHLVDYATQSAIVKAQQADPTRNVFTGKTFAEEEKEGSAGSSNFDMESLFSIDEEKISAAFTFDSNALSTAMSAMDFGSFDTSALAAAPTSMPSIDFSTLPMPTMDTSAFTAIDLGAIDTTALADQFPQLASIDWVNVLNSAVGDGVLGQNAPETLANLGQELFTGFLAYQNDNAGNGKTVQELAQEYFAQESVVTRISDVLGNSQIIDTEKLGTNLVAALGEDPAVQGMVTAVQEQVTTALTQQMGTQISAMIEQMMGAQMAAVMEQSITTMMTGLQTQIASQIEASMAQMSTVMTSAFKVDESKFAEAFQSKMNPEELSSLMTSMMRPRAASYSTNLERLGYADLTDPSQINIYPQSFADKDAVKSILDEYNEQARTAGHDDKVITYTDMVGLLMSSITNIIAMISAMLIAFVAISLVVSSIMIGIITYISVLERKKEIGILRSIGASKGDIRSVFNAETVLVGLLAGAIGVGITYLLTIPANAIVENLYDVSGIAQLPALAAAILVAISVGLTLLAGLLPAGKAAKADPVEALRSE
ncbi:ABC transporter ATP-binding protein/permease [Schaalia suimastitidis]|uniref:ABC transporter ATP-binding protein/permease n=1 Tax=Schaalia suimastitidis TaxID=121163 RepID=UPI0003FACC90|nr:ABC transporter ATP-binding protein/permease [Schaalia suimastitidis]